jgi:hypothetical protein
MASEKIKQRQFSFPGNESGRCFSLAPLATYWHCLTYRPSCDIFRTGQFSFPGNELLTCSAIPHAARLGGGEVSADFSFPFCPFSVSGFQLFSIQAPGVVHLGKPGGGGEAFTV